MTRYNSTTTLTQSAKSLLSRRATSRTTRTSWPTRTAGSATRTRKWCPSWPHCSTRSSPGRGYSSTRRRASSKSVSNSSPTWSTTGPSPRWDRRSRVHSWKSAGQRMGLSPTTTSGLTSSSTITSWFSVGFYSRVCKCSMMLIGIEEFPLDAIYYRLKGCLRDSFNYLC